MNAATLPCPKCRGAFEPPAGGVEMDCPRCRAPLLVAVFPVFGRGLAAGGTGAPVVAEGDAGCFFHPGRLAAVVCGGCGRFLCALCDVEFAGGRWCPKCLADARRQEAASFPQTRVRHDYLVLMTVVLSLLAFPAAVVTGPFAIGYAAWAWRRPPGLAAASRPRLVVAAVLAALLTALAAWFWMEAAFR
ncbi:MAG TPA: hypothetical protein PKE47_02855 [Verrucomicrobiota bacterium]|nr:hypothetical protein [Verrucomicrobiota bacterium]